MARTIDKRRKIEKKYSTLISKLLEDYKDKTMGELWAKFEELKIQMKNDFDKAGIILEDN